MQHVFVYGSLLFPGIVKGLTGQSFQTVDATLNDFQRCAVKEVEYPALVEKSGAQVIGKVLLNVDKRSFDVLRFYEGNEYECLEVEVETGNKKLSACVFIWIGRAEILEEIDWDPDIFKHGALAEYLHFVIPETKKEFERLFP